MLGIFARIWYLNIDNEKEVMKIVWKYLFWEMPTTEVDKRIEIESEHIDLICSSVQDNRLQLVAPSLENFMQTLICLDAYFLQQRNRFEIESNFSTLFTHPRIFASQMRWSTEHNLI